MAKMYNKSTLTTVILNGIESSEAAFINQMSRTEIKDLTGELTPLIWQYIQSNETEETIGKVTISE